MMFNQLGVGQLLRQKLPTLVQCRRMGSHGRDIGQLGTGRSDQLLMDGQGHLADDGIVV